MITKADSLGTALLVEAPAAGSSAPGARAVPEALVDGSVPDRVVVLSPDTSRRWLNVDYGNNVLFVVRQPGATDRIVQWRFDGLANMISYGDIDPYADFARSVKIYVDQSTNPLRSSLD